MTPRNPPSAIALVTLGALAGFVSGLLGVGGGSVLVPALVLFLGVGQHRAHATSLAAIVFTVPAALLPFVRDGEVVYAAGAAIAVGAIIGAVAGADLMHRISPGRLRVAFALVLIVVGIRLLFGGGVALGGSTQVLDLARLLAFGGLGLLAGALSSLLGVGGGIIMVPALALLFGFDQHLAQGTSLLVIFPTALVGSLRHTRNGYSDWRMGVILGNGGVAGGLLGGLSAQALPATTLQRLFSVLVLVAAARLLWPKRQDTDAPDAGATAA